MLHFCAVMLPDVYCIYGSESHVFVFKVQFSITRVTKD